MACPFPFPVFPTILLLKMKAHIKNGGHVGYACGSVTRSILDIGSDHDLTVREIEPRGGLRTDNMWSAWDPLTPFAPLPLACTCARSLKINKQNKKNGRHEIRESKMTSMSTSTQTWMAFLWAPCHRRVTCVYLRFYLFLLGITFLTQTRNQFPF